MITYGNNASNNNSTAVIGDIAQESYLPQLAADEILKVCQLYQ
jgi:hypothetical protein